MLGCVRTCVPFFLIRAPALKPTCWVVCVHACRFFFYQHVLWRRFVKRLRGQGPLRPRFKGGTLKKLKNLGSW
jgi:hypothetical protein